MTHISRFTFLLLVYAACFAGCSRLVPREESEPLQFLTTADDLAVELANYDVYMEERLRRAADDILAEARQRDTRMAATVLKSALIAKFHQRINQAEPAVALLDTWSFAARVDYYLTEGDGKNLFDAQQPLAVAAGKDLLRHVESIALRNLPKESLEVSRSEITEFVRERQLTGMFDEVQPTRFSFEERGRRAVGVLTRLPFAPVRAATQSVNPMGSVAESVHRFSDVVEDLPEDLRVQTEILALNLRDSDTLTSALLAVDSIAMSADRISLAAARLPDDLRELAGELEAAQPELQRTLAETNTVLLSAREAIDSLEATAGKSQLMFEQAGTMSDSVRETIEAANALTAGMQDLVRMFERDDSASDPEDGKPFDILEYHETLESARAALEELRGALADIERMGRSDLLDRKLSELNEQTSELIDLGDGAARGLIDYFFARLVMLAVLIAVLALVYRLLTHYLTRRRT